MNKILLLLSILMLVSCDWLKKDCDKQMANIRSQFGAPEEINRYDSGDYHSVDFWYWSKGKQFGFTWSGDRKCEQSTYTFSPITKPLTDEIREHTIRNKQLAIQEGGDRIGCSTCP
jgi:hypothetical protein